MAEELGTKDVLEQVHTRLGTLEQDVRALDTKFDARFDRLIATMDARFVVVGTEIRELRSDVNGRLDKTVRWLIGLFFAGWLSLVGAMASIWLKLP